MKKTQSEIFNDMKSTYEERIDENLDENSAMAKALEAISTEIYGLYCYGNYIMKQSFAQTAGGEYLDRLAQLRGVTRKAAQKASGKLRFYLDEPINDAVILNEGIICSVKGKPELQYVTVGDYGMMPGSTFCDVNARAITAGAKFNVKAQEITVMVNAPVSISGVYNEDAFTGGYDAESDESLRYRLINHFAFEPNGMNTQFLENTVMQLDFVIDCFIPRSDTFGEFNVYVTTKSGSLAGNQITQIRNALAISELVFSNVSVHNAGLQDFNLNISLKTRKNFDNDLIKAELDEIIDAEFAKCRIGRPFCMSDIEKRALMIDGVLDAMVESPQAISKTIYCDYNKRLNLTNTEVKFYEA